MLLRPRSLVNLIWRRCKWSFHRDFSNIGRKCQGSVRGRSGVARRQKSLLSLIFQYFNKKVSGVSGVNGVKSLYGKKAPQKTPSFLFRKRLFFFTWESKSLLPLTPLTAKIQAIEIINEFVIFRVFRPLTDP